MIKFSKLLLKKHGLSQCLHYNEILNGDEVIKYHKFDAIFNIGSFNHKKTSVKKTFFEKMFGSQIL